MSVTEMQGGHFTEAFDPLDPEVVKHANEWYERLRSEAPVFYDARYGHWIATSYDICMQIVQDPARFSSAQGNTHHFPPPSEHLDALKKEGLDPESMAARFPEPPVRVLPGADPPEHDRQREAVARLMSPKRIDQMEDQIRALADELIDRFADRGKAEFFQEFCWPFPAYGVCLLVGAPRDFQDRFTRPTPGERETLMPSATLEQRIRGAKRGLQMSEYTWNLVAEREREPKDDLISDMIRSDALSKAEIVSSVNTFLGAGQETTTKSLGSGLLLLLDHPEEVARLKDDSEYARSVVEEIFRLEGPVRGLMRTAMEDVQFGDVTVKQGERIMMLFASANRDPEQFPEAEAFRGDRKPNRHMAFGLGIHYCLGAPLARLEMRVAFQQLFKRLPNLRLDPDYEPQFYRSYITRGPAELHMVWDVPGS